MIPSFNRMSYFRDMVDENKLKAKIEQRYLEHQTGNKTAGVLDAMAEDRAILECINSLAKEPITEEQFKQYVVWELDSCGYFMADLDVDILKQVNPNWKPYSSKSFGEMLLDFACQWNMEHEGKNYEYKLKED